MGFHKRYIDDEQIIDIYRKNGCQAVIDWFTKGVDALIISGDVTERVHTALDILDVDDVLVSQTDIEPHTAIPNLDAEANLIPKDSNGERLSYTSKLDGNDAMYISVIQQLITKIETLEAEVEKLKG